MILNLNLVKTKKKRSAKSNNHKNHEERKSKLHKFRSKCETDSDKHNKHHVRG